MKKKLAVILLALMLSACGPTATPTRSPTNTPRPPSIESKLVLSEKKCWLERDVMEFSGVITNNSSATLEYVQIRMKAYMGYILVGENTWYIDSDQLRPGASSSYDGFIRLGGQEAKQCDVEVDDFRVQK